MRSEPKIEVTCDGCPEGHADSIEIGLTTTARGYDERNVEDSIEAEGWKVIDGKDYCQSCKEEKNQSGGQKVRGTRIGILLRFGSRCQNRETLLRNE